jgi:energy-coupling factor transporter ATP-binding protein EcfA2
MAILTLQDTQLAYGELPLLDRAALAMESGKRLGLIGRNGTGKSSLLGAIAGRVALDDGELRIRDGLRIAMIEQEPVLPLAATLKQSLLGRASVHQEHKLNEYLDRFGLNPNGAFQPEWERAAERGKCGQVRVPVWRRCAVLNGCSAGRIGRCCTRSISRQNLGCTPGSVAAFVCRSFSLYRTRGPSSKASAQ